MQPQDRRPRSGNLAEEAPGIRWTRSWGHGWRVAFLLTAVGLSGILMLLLICGVSLVYLGRSGAGALPFRLPLFGLAAGTAFPGASPSSPQAPTFPLGFNPQPSPTPTAAAILQTPVPSTRPFKPVAATATPVGSEITDPSFLEGVAAFQSKRYEDVISLMSAVIERSPQLAPPYRYRGDAYWGVGDCASGLDDEEKALSIIPDYAAAWASHGLMKACLGDMNQALADYSKALSLDPSLAFVHHNLGVYYFDLGDYQKALEEYTFSTTIDPTRSGAWDGQSEALARLGRYPECVEAASRAIQANPEEWLAYRDRADCQMRLANYTASLADYSLYLAHDPEDATVLYDIGVVYGRRGETYFLAGKYTEAIADLKMAVQRIPRDAHSYRLLAYSYFELKQFGNALDAGKSSVAINPAPGAKTYEVMARSSYALKDYDQAIAYMNQALDQQQYALGYYYRGIMFQAAGRNQEASKDLKYFMTYDPAGAEAEDAKARLAQLGP